jgi:predicted nucleic acid-binding protein
VLVVDASLVVEWSLAEGELQQLLGDELCAPPLMWSETRSVLHEHAWRGVIDSASAHRARDRLNEVEVQLRDDVPLGEEAWRIADELGWAKTYDAEYLALASILGCRLVTIDARLRRGADRLGYVVEPTEL